MIKKVKMNIINKNKDQKREKEQNAYANLFEKM